ncbi:MAG TPA: threonine synthase [Anaerolineaceae bacterium]|nr:MAG: Threonine synthase [Anaerolineaceae bacterium 46_22]HAF49279.1 threonine synthase [Anaerolineaceae bacterium]
MKHKFSHYECSICGANYNPGEVTYTCPKDGGNLNVILDYAELNKNLTRDKFMNIPEASLWRYINLLPVFDPGGFATPLHQAGWTPVYQPKRLAKKLGLKHLWIKDESPNPTASFKDRASAIVVARAQEIDAEVIVAASTGNAGAALAGMAAAVGAKAVIFAPKTAPPAKIAQLIVFGAQVLLVDGNYDQAFDLSIEATQNFGWYNRNTGYNPFTAEGKKTAAFEIWEQVIRGLPETGKPLTIFIPVGDGNIISGVHKGFKDLYALGWLPNMPRIIGVQSEGSAAIANTFHQGDEDIKPVQATTLADSISVDLPRDGVRAIRAARDTGGTYITVPDSAILEAIADLGRVGIFAEPAASTAYAGLVKALEEAVVQPEDPVLVLSTGSGLKDVKAAMQAVTEAPVIEPSLEAVKKVLQ